MKNLATTHRSYAEVAAAVADDYARGREVIAEFHRLWYGSLQTWSMTKFEGVPVLKNPLDLWVYQELIWNLRPTLIIETGTAFGGSALFYARCLDKRGPGAVISVDCDPALDLPTHPKIAFITGYSTDPSIVEEIRKVAATHPRVMVVLDSDHGQANVELELEAYAPMVSPGQFLVVEDTNLNGRPLDMDWEGGPGPGPAVDAWLPAHPEFAPEPLAERYLLTMHPGGWLRRRIDG